jgi:hypothetical protein
MSVIAPQRIHANDIERIAADRLADAAQRRTLGGLN